MNYPQRMNHIIQAHDVRGVASRRVGKTESIGDRVFQVAKSMPQGMGAWGGISRPQLYCKLIPAALAAASRFYGLTPGVHYGPGKPPSWVPRPITDLRNYSDAIWFANGFIWAAISMSQVASANSYTFNHAIFDECRFARKQKIYEELVPAVSGQTHPFGDPGFSRENPLYCGTYFVSDASLTIKGAWLEQEEEKLDDKPMLGPFTDMTYRQIQEELETFAKSVIKYNDLIYYARKEHRQIIEVTPERKAEIEQMAKQIEAREGAYKIIPRQYKDINKAVCDMLVNYKLTDQDTANLLYNHKYLITKEDHFEMMKLNLGKSYLKRIEQLRASAFYCWRASTLDNADIVTFEYIAQMYRELPAGVFGTSILNLRKRKANDGFYTNLDIENIHGYIPDDAPCIDKSVTLQTATQIKSGAKYTEQYEAYDFDRLARVDDCTQDGDVVDALPLHIAFDYNDKMNVMVTGQVYKRDGVECLNVLGSMYVQYERKLHALLEDWNRYYGPHKNHNRTVYYYYDSTAKFRGYAIEGNLDFKDTIIGLLKKYQWDVVGVDMGHPMFHTEKWKIINEALGGFSAPGIRINRINNEVLILAMEQAEIKISYTGTTKTIKKDKSKEKQAETEDNPIETRTDITDAFDSLFIGVKLFRFRTSLLMTPGGC
jgi:hypothetical protein